MYLYQEGPYEGTLSLSKEASLHLKARRLRENDVLTLFDGTGQVAKAKLVGLGRVASCEVLETSVQTPQLLPRLVIGITKLSTLEFILQKATEIGVSEIILLKTEYTPISFDQALFEKKKDRWDKILLAACEQSEKVIKPILSWQTFEDYMQKDRKRYMLHLEGTSTKIDKDCDLMVGPEGGWSPAELTSDVEKLKLDTGILRSDTACIAALLFWKLS